MTVREAFEKFKSNLEITEEEETTASGRHNRVRELLDGTFELENHFLTGSYRRETKTKPLKDVDIFCVLKANNSTRRAYRENNPSNVLSAFEKVLREECGDRVSIGRRSVSIDFGPEERIVSFDVVPAFERSGRGYEVPDGKLGIWIASDPTEHASQATEKNKELDNKWKPLVKMIKGWNRANDNPVKPSFLLEVMAMELVAPEFTNYPWELQTFFASAAERVTDSWPDPAGLGPDVNDTMSDTEKRHASLALQRAAGDAAAARRLENAGQENDAKRAWRMLLGLLFPVS
ncbi:nucleotidyltransferase [Acidobacteriia bacterium AH_259_A11_L15]|nr:nucleotidyltransferase [Acidobacteriia bacterium AH_259_A11_L15]